MVLLTIQEHVNALKFNLMRAVVESEVKRSSQKLFEWISSDKHHASNHTFPMYDKSRILVAFVLSNLSTGRGECNFIMTQIGRVC